MDQQKRIDLIEHIKEIGSPDPSGVPLVTIEEFFEGNDDLGSIGCNLLEHPGLEFFYEQLKAIRDRENVSNVLVGIYEVEESDETMWPFAETVFVTTSEELQNVVEWFAPLEPDSVEVEMIQAKNLPEIPDGHAIYVAWWD
ncbi:MAG: hypothetical protein KDK99_07045 [Verrucomicrobiales bacterium]|nr:hypothetical protein [Verrucomicrobiales bacterium]